MEEFGLFACSVTTGVGFFSSYFVVKKLELLEICKKVTDTDFTGFGYVEGIIDSPNPFKFTFGNTPYSLVIKKMAYTIPIKSYNRNSKGELRPSLFPNLISGILEIASPVKVGEFVFDSKFVIDNFPMYPLNVTHSFNPSISLNFMSGEFSYDDDAILTKLYGVPCGTKFTVIGDFKEGIIRHSKNLNYVGDISFNVYKQSVEDSYQTSKFVTLVSGIGALCFGLAYMFKQ